MYIARQPIFNRDMKVYAYELLYRDDINSSRFGSTSNQVATATVMAGLFENGINNITDGKKAFVNFDEEMLFSDVPYLFKPNELVIENLETVRATEQVVDRITKLREDGYTIALDDFVEDYDSYDLVEQARIIKFDLIATPLSEISEPVKKALRDGKLILAEKVESLEEFEEAKRMGFHLFQGFFFQKPYIVSKSESKVSYAAHYALILSELNKSEPSFQKLAEIFETNIDLAYKVIKLAGNKNIDEDIYSIKKALVYMGFADLKLWVSILMMRDIGSHKSPELMRLALVRAKFAELLCKRKIVDTMPLESFMLGLFSTLDALMDEDMLTLMLDMPFSEELKNGLIRKSGQLKDLFDFMIAYESGNLGELENPILREGADTNLVYESYLEAVAWGGEMYKEMKRVS